MKLTPSVACASIGFMWACVGMVGVKMDNQPVAALGLAVGTAATVSSSVVA